MAAIHTYPTGTPAASDYVPYVADPTGSPVMRNTLVSDINAGFSWTQVVDEPGDALTNWTVASGTWNSSGSYIECTANGFLRYNTAFETAISIIEAETMIVTNTGDRYAEFCLAASASTAKTAQQTARIQRVSSTWNWHVELGGQTAVTNGSFSGAEDTWYKMRQVFIGNRAIFYIDDTRYATYDVAHNISMDRIGLSVVGATIRYRNIKAWTADLGLPA